MKNSLLFLLILGLCTQASFAQNVLPKNKIELKIKQYTHLKSVGNTIAFTGGAATVTGLYLYAKSAGKSNFYSSDFNQLIVGTMLTVIGVGMIAGGATMATIANFKKKKYEKQLSGLSFVPLLSPNMNGFSLQYKF